MGIVPVSLLGIALETSQIWKTNVLLYIFHTVYTLLRKVFQIMGFQCNCTIMVKAEDKEIDTKHIILNNREYSYGLTFLGLPCLNQFLSLGDILKSKKQPVKGQDHCIYWRMGPLSICLKTLYNSQDGCLWIASYDVLLYAVTSVCQITTALRVIISKIRSLFSASSLWPNSCSLSHRFKIIHVFGTMKLIALESWQICLFKQHFPTVCWQVFPECFEHSFLVSVCANVHSNRKEVFSFTTVGTGMGLCFRGYIVSDLFWLWGSNSTAEKHSVFLSSKDYIDSSK